MRPLDGGGTNAAVRRRWFRLGIALAVGNALFTLLVVALLRIDPSLAILVAVVVGTLSAVALTLYVTYLF